MIGKKSIRLQVLIESNLYNKLFETLQEIKAPFKSESEGVRYAIMYFIKYETEVKTTMYLMKQQLDTKRDQIAADQEKIKALQADNNRIFTKMQQLEIENEQIKKKFEGVKNEGTPRKKQKKSSKKVLQKT